MKKETMLKFGRKEMENKEDRTYVPLSGLTLKQIKKSKLHSTPFKDTWITLSSPLMLKSTL